ncbi:hypothetical protein [Caulobacter sp. CCH9-E1]|uniref:hypothetical protein n=1 Tax=Caulobacter sp. CCH9-E1 TaxID=1768768 RepID=UPI000831F2B2|nr:hypothetical protein [Caulobacter sp. CCH9-E1]
MSEKPDLELAKILLTTTGAMWGFYGATLIALMKSFVVDKIQPPRGVGIAVKASVALFIAVNFVAIALFQSASGLLLAKLLHPVMGCWTGMIGVAVAALLIGHLGLGIAAYLALAYAFKTTS